MISISLNVKVYSMTILKVNDYLIGNTLILIDNVVNGYFIGNTLRLTDIDIIM